MNEITEKNNKSLTKIQGILTSRIETRKQPATETIYHYGFFEFEGLAVQIPVIFKTPEKPTIPKGSQVILTGIWAEPTNNKRQSFTAQAYEITQTPEPPTIPKLKELAQSLLNITLEKYKECTNRKNFLFRKLEELKELETLANFSPEYLQAYLLYKGVEYANYQPEHLAETDFDLTKYLAKIAFELELTQSRLTTQERKENSHE